MTPHPDRGPGQTAAGEPIAIVGIAALYPQARDAEEYWRLLGSTELRCGCAAAEPGGEAAWNSCGRTAAPPARTLADVEVDVARYGIPPAQARSMARMQLLMLEAARQCLTDAGYAQRPLPTDRTDVVTGTCFGLDRQHANALRIDSARYTRELERVAVGGGLDPPQAAEAARELRSVLLDRLGGSPHDRVGEMASTIPARIAAAFRLRGRTLALESADATSFLAVWHAVGTLRAGSSDAALVLVGQRRESPLLDRALAAKGLAAPGTHPFSAGGRGFALGEGVGAVLLKRLSSAVADGDRIYASILDCSLRHDSRPGTFRYSTSVHRRGELAAASWRSADGPGQVQYVECAGTGIAVETEAELAALSGVLVGALPATVAVGSARDRLGHTFANAGMASLTKVALALYHRKLPPYWSPPGTRSIDLTGTPFHLPRAAAPWPVPPGGGVRRAAVSGASVTGTLGHLVLSEYDARRAPTAGPPTAVAPRRVGAAAAAVAARRTGPAGVAPIAVVSVAARFAGSPDADAVWRTTCSGRDRIAPLPDTLLDRDLYYAPGALSLERSYTDLGAFVPVPAQPPDGVAIPPHRWERMDAAQRLALVVAGQLLAGPQRPRGRGVVAVGSNLGLSRERQLAALLGFDQVEAAAAGLAALARLPGADRDLLLGRVRERLAGSPLPDSPASLDGCLASGVAALIAHECHLDAVPVAVEAACASSLAALDVAMTALRSGAVDFAVAGGVELPCNTRDLVLCSSLGLLSHGRITPFDAAADGFTPGDGCALVLLKRLADARRDGDRILGLLRGIGASNDAKSLIAPDAEGQARAMRQAFDQVDFGPDGVGYLEAHGTGTRVGDRVELAATAMVYSAPRERPLWISSAKSYLGHTFAAAGGAGLIRALHAVRVGTLPPAANLNTLDPSLDLAAIPAVVPTEAAPWTVPSGRPRRAAVSSFGTGGINYHLLIEQHLDGTP